ncbi:MAG: hypothetical protein SFU99_19340 [Saprospiraceae bacterium]|nr:hypothetical protein [Saprospiraceae bacterium]
MALFRFNKVPKHQQFDYKPRFWDPEKEEQQERLKRIKMMGTDDPEATKSRIAAGFRTRAYGNTGSYRRQQVMRSNAILFAVVVGLLLLTFLLLTNYLPRLIQLFE